MGFLDKSGLTYLWGKIVDRLEQKVDKVIGKGLSENDYTTAEKTKLAGIATGATANVVENVLTSTSTTNALSAAMGKSLSEDVAALESRFGNISIPADSDGIIPVGSTEHAILIVVSGWVLSINGYAWVCSGYSTGASRKAVNQIGSGTNLTCTADETGYKIHNSGNTAANVHVLYIYNS